MLLTILCFVVMATVAITAPPPQSTDSPAKYRDCQECASRYGFSGRHWLRLVDQGKAPPPTRFGRLVRWNITVLEAWEEAGCPSCRRAK
jgi:predicted DNA-binding transcriptional regulator AlpA